MNRARRLSKDFETVVASPLARPMLALGSPAIRRIARGTISQRLIPSLRLKEKICRIGCGTGGTRREHSDQLYMSNEDTGLGLPTLVGRSVPYPIGSRPLCTLGIGTEKMRLLVEPGKRLRGAEPETLSSWGCHLAATLASSSCN